ncbi:D-2-hydroxyacid dehydrogenase [Jiangella asiatica]|uniref:D-2-hydroxyacid dehydrogenase n=1 Tax=Jiangella asiatica TaxID=2530372 RepID=A0A4R5CA30_9ACTN|nr:D-2-hydroxyacid dehydrogenase [Jiangella asiatica]TDD96771.1 D-2-hydroxyacid dehydrogenase [Jiangella asiatica]
MTESVLVAMPVHDAWLARVRERLPGGVVDCREPIRPGQRLPVAEIGERTVLFADHVPANAEDMPALRWIQLGSAGYQQLAGRQLAAGVRVTNASGVNDVPIAEWCVLMMLALARRLPDSLRDQAERRWDRDVSYQSELRGRRVGIFGYGSIGREVARLCRALGLEVWAVARSGVEPRPHRYHPDDSLEEVRPDRGFAPAQLDAFLRGLDVLAITSPLTPRTRGVFGARELALLPRHAVLLNPARAHVVDESALLAALRDGTLAGAALDSHYREPMPPDDPFWTAPNTIVTPHVSGSTGSTHFADRVWDLFARNLDRYRTGAPLLNEIDPADWRH